MADEAPEQEGGRRARRRRVAAVWLALSALALAYPFVVEPRWLETTEHQVGEGPPALTLMHLSDLHVTGAGWNERRVLDLLDAVRPDLVVITGDTVSDTEGTFDAAPVRAFLEQVVARRPPLGVFACRGNHEDWVGPPALAAIRDAGVEVLDDRVVTLLGGRLALHGLTGPRAAGVAGAPTTAYDVVLCHYPTALSRVAAPGLELVLAGHTHGGQVRLPLIGALVVPFESGPYHMGWFAHGGTRLYVSRGVGTSLLPVRFACRPEVAIHRLDLVPDSDRKD